MFSNLKESTLWTFALFGTFLAYLWFGTIALTDWMKGFALVDKWFFTFFLTKVGVALIGLLMTPFPLWLLIAISFLPLPVVLPIFFIAFIVMFKQF
jgi:hypothetical protein